MLFSFSQDTITTMNAVCCICNVLFNALPALLEHMQQHHPLALFCNICGKVFSTKFNLSRHTKIHQPCTHCGATFNSSASLKAHCKTAHAPSLECTVCHKTFNTKQHLTRHEKLHALQHCEECGKAFQSKVLLKAHKKTHLSLATASDPQPSTDPRNPPSAACPPAGCQSALGGAVKRIRVAGTEEDVDLGSFLRAQNHSQLLQDALRRKKAIKFFVSVNVKMVRPKTWLTTGDMESFPYFTSRCLRMLEANNIEENLETAYQKMEKDLENYLREGSGWVVGHIQFVELFVFKYKPLRGSSYIPLPAKIAKTRGIVNVKNEDQHCFLWAVLSALYPTTVNPHRLYNYMPYAETLKVGDLKLPMSPNDIPKFEKLNNLSINLFGYQEKQVFPLYISDSPAPAINLLLISNGQTQHYCWIKDFNKLMHSNTKNQAFYCMYCLHRFSSQRTLNAHGESCRIRGPQKIRFPEGEERFLKFNHPAHSLPVPYVIYCDFESLIVPMSEQAGLCTKRVAEHRPVSFCCVVVGPEGQLTEPPLLYRGEDCVNVFLDFLKVKEKEIGVLKQQNLPMDITDEEETNFRTATSCHICSHTLEGASHRDHDHLTGQFRGAAHPGCNVNFKFRDFIPVVLHNLRGYDSHLIMQEIGKYKDAKIECLANNLEKYISFTFGTLRFVDSLQFMPESLERLAANLAKSGKEKFNLTQQCFPEDKLDYVLAKGHFPYEYFNSLDRLQETELPPQSTFWSSLYNSGISDEEYAHAKSVWRAFDMQNFGDYHDLYLKTDVLLLADVFQNFRQVCQSCYGLDPCHYYTSPGLAWDAALKKSGITLELLTDPDMHLFIEDGTRGGISMISNRYAKANNKYLPTYDPSARSSYIMYLDANNLYGWALSQPLPVGGFKWVDSPLDISAVPDDGDTGYILEVDLRYPEELHDLHSDYPLAPESMVIGEEMLSPFTKALGHNTTKVKKLVPNLRNKEKYILHYRNLKFYLAHGMQVTKIHRVLEFTQSPWLKTYIDFNTAQRAKAKNEFEKNFFKLLNNAVFGKTIENLRKRRNVKLAHTKPRLEKLVAQPGFESCRIFNEDLVGVEMRNTSLYLCRPIYVGFSVLDLSKILMYSFYYDVLKSKYGDQIKLLFTDTDSLTVQVFTDDVYKDMKSFAIDLDTSDYPTTHPLYSTLNKKVIGKMKDELNSTPIVSFVGLRAKMYSIKPLTGGEKKTAKGISRSVIKNDYHHEDYERVLFEGQSKMADMMRIQSNKHHLYSLKIHKLGLSAADDKRYILPNGCDTLAHGHYIIQDDVE